jgi:hypothetical protein
MKSNPVLKLGLKVLEFEFFFCLKSEYRVLEIGRTKLKPTPEEPPNQFFTASKPRLEALFTGKNCTTLINSSISSLILLKRL